MKLEQLNETHIAENYSLFLNTAACKKDEQFFKKIFILFS